MASFLTLVWSRRHWNDSWGRLNQSSHCFRCKRVVRGYDNIPLVSWLVLHGRCRDCGGSIPGSYWLAEVAGAVLAGLLVRIWL
ncbi:MAG: prepilin peptidase [Sulfuritalea sp.]|nr:prepilin peptidase [Sulfuritalea sp.]